MFKFKLLLILLAITGLFFLSKKVTNKFYADHFVFAQSATPTPTRRRESDDDQEEHRRTPTPTPQPTSTPKPTATPDTNYNNQVDTLVKKQSKPKVVQTTPETVTAPEIQYIKVIDPGYDVDSDGDGLVDALDPDPKVSQLNYFTDSDGDGVPDAVDVYPGQDDFSFTGNIDANNNGIIDAYEQ